MDRGLTVALATAMARGDEGIDLPLAVPSPPGSGTFDLQLGLVQTPVRVLRFSGREAVSRLFSFDVTFATAMEPALLEPLVLGAPATFVMQLTNRPPRVVQGIVARLRAEGPVHELSSPPGAVFTVRIVPKMWLLKRRQSSRIFQDIPMNGIVDAILSEAGIPRRWSLSRPVARRSYCVQHQETDFAFVTRILAEEGVFFYFEPPPALPDLPAALDPLQALETVVFADHPQAYGAIGSSPLPAPPSLAIDDLPSVPFCPRTGTLRPTDEHVFRFARERLVRPKAVHLRDYDFRHPTLILTARARLATSVSPGDTPPPASDGEARDTAAPLLDVGALEIYEHHGEYEEPEVATARAGVVLKQYRVRARTAAGASTSRRLSPGFCFRLEGHPEPSFDRAYVVTSVAHEGSIPERSVRAEGAPIAAVYENEFECAPSDVAFRPRRPRRKLQQVLESAVVVGPPGEEIYTDEYGRIKVQFHWDREGQHDARSSCWIRVAHPWAGAAWGFQFIPRVGMEVLVSFLGGDEDRPIIVGAAYNHTHPTPFRLPHQKTRSGLRTQSTPNGHGFNELSFDDAAGQGIVFLQAQKDLEERILHDRLENVGHDQRVEVGNLQIENVHGERHDAVHGNESRSVGGLQTSHVGGNQRTTVIGRQTVTVSGGVVQAVNGFTFSNQGSHHATVEGFESHTVGTAEAETGLGVMVYGTADYDATEGITLRSEKNVTLVVGDSSITLSKDAIRIESKKIIAKASDTLTLFGNGPVLELAKEATLLGDKVHVISKGASVEMDDQTLQAGAKNGVDLACDPQQKSVTDDNPQAQTKPFKWTMLDLLRQPLKNKNYTLVTQGFRTKGTTDGSGVIELEVPATASSAQLTVWPDRYPTGPRIHYSVRLGDIPAATSPVGAQLRLKNLGYYAGPETDDITPDFAAALATFQRDHQLPGTGELDGPTQSKLGEVHG